MEIRWTEEASKNLESIHYYIHRENENAANKTITGIFERIQILKQFLNIGHVYANRHNYEIRILIYGHYKIAYHIFDTEFVEILGIFHGAMNLEDHLTE